MDDECDCGSGLSVAECTGVSEAEEVEEVEEEVELCDECGNEKDGGCICCAECHLEYCECCSVCGEYTDGSCECCYECECMECSCFSGYGTSERTPWERRGIKISQSCNNGRSWESTWPEIDTSIDPVQSAADFYLLEAMFTQAVFNYTLKSVPELSDAEENELLDLLAVTNPDVRQHFKDVRRIQASELIANDPNLRLASLEKKAREEQELLVEILDASFVPYVHIAVAGEIRHHQAIKARVLSDDRNQAWSDWRKVYEAVGNQALRDLEELFLEFERGSYGGPKWADACVVLYQRLENMLGPDELSNKKMFVDRVFSIQHNGGALLDKVAWAILNCHNKSVGHLPSVLENHHQEVPGITELFRLASSPVQNLFIEFVEVAELCGAQPTHETFGFEPLRAFVSLKPLICCKGCSLQIEEGHTWDCDKAFRARFDDNGDVIFDGKVMRQEWNHDYMKQFHKLHRPVAMRDKYGNPFLDMDSPVQAQLIGYVNFKGQVDGADVDYNRYDNETSFRIELKLNTTFRDVLNGLDIPGLPVGEQIISYSIEAYVRPTSGEGLYFGSHAYNYRRAIGNPNFVVRTAGAAPSFRLRMAAVDTFLVDNKQKEMVDSTHV